MESIFRVTVTVTRTREPNFESVWTIYVSFVRTKRRKEEGITDEDLSETAADSKAEDVDDDLRVSAHKGESIGELGTPRVEEKVAER